MATDRLQAVILDMDGLMLDTESIYKRAWETAASELGYAFEDELYLTCLGQPLQACEAVLKRFGKDFPLDDFRTRWQVLWKSEVESSGISTKPGLEDLLEDLKNNGIPAAVATSSGKDYANFSLQKAQLHDQFEIIVSGDQVPHGKPAPDIYLETASRLKVAPHNCIAIEDSDAGVIAACSAGMNTVMVPDIKEPSPQAKAVAFCVVSSLIEARERVAPFVEVYQTDRHQAAVPPSDRSNVT